MKPAQGFNCGSGANAVYFEILTARCAGSGKLVQHGCQRNLAERNTTGFQEGKKLMCNAKVAFQCAGRKLTYDRQHVLCRILASRDGAKENRGEAQPEKQLRPMRAAVLRANFKGEPGTGNPDLPRLWRLQMRTGAWPGWLRRWQEQSQCFGRIGRLLRPRKTDWGSGGRWHGKTPKR